MRKRERERERERESCKRSELMGERSRKLRDKATIKSTITCGKNMRIYAKNNAMERENDVGGRKTMAPVAQAENGAVSK